MPRRSGSSVVAIVLGAVVVVGAASLAGTVGGAKGFVATCLVGSIVVGLVLTKDEQPWDESSHSQRQETPGHSSGDRDLSRRFSLGQDPLFRLEVGAIWRWMKTQPLSFWLVSLYLFLEYVRPQAIYSAISGWPLSYWTIVLCGVVFLLEGAKFRRWHLGDGLMAAATLSVLLSTVTAYEPTYARENYSIFFGWLIVYVLITNIVGTRHRFYVFMLLYLLYCVKMTQHGVRSWAGAGFHFIKTGVGCAPGWFRNSGECGAQMDVLFPLSLFFFLALYAYWDKWKRWAYVAALPLGSLLTILASSSRGAVIGVAAAGAWFVAKSRRRLKVLMLALMVAALSWYIVPESFKARFQTIGKDPDSLVRLMYWRDGVRMLHNFPIFGVGYYNWSPYYRRFYDPGGQLPHQVPHNIFIEAAAQQGYFGLIVFVACILGTFVIDSRTRRLSENLGGVGVFYRNVAHGLDAALVGFLVSGSFVTILYYPFFWINLAMAVSVNVAALDEVRRADRSPRRIGRGVGSADAPETRSVPPAGIRPTGRGA